MGSNRSINNPVVLFDGVCNLCNSSVQFIIKRDSKSRIKFASLQSEFGVKVLSDFDQPKGVLNSVLLLKENRLYQKSNAALEIAKLLDGLWPIFYVFKIVPAPIRDFIYDWIARNRYKWFGMKDECMIPTPDLKSRFIID
jgi:predicted DCC family thiol-disulfide oxidoreductase YuxK